MELMDIQESLSLTEASEQMWRGKLIRFLKRGLKSDSYINLKSESEKVFYLRLPMNKGKNVASLKPFEKILKDWYKYKDRLHKYVNYSTAKAAFQTALIKNVNLITLDAIGDKRRFRFATKEEAEEKRKMLKERAAKNNNRRNSLSPNPPSLVSAEVGDELRPIQEISSPMHNEELNNNQMLINSGILEEKLENNDHVSKMDCGEIELLDQLVEDIQDINYYETVEKIKNFLEDCSSKIILDEAPKNKINDEALERTSSDALGQQPFDPESFLNQVNESAFPVISSVVPKKTYWMVTYHQKVEDILMLICEKRDIETQGIEEGSISIPNNVLEPGTSYVMKKFFPIDKYFFCFLLPTE